MHLSDSILGKSTVEKLRERSVTPILIIGSDKFTRTDLAKLSCFNFTAAAMLSNILTKEMKVKDTNDLFKNVKPGALAVPGLGVISLATLGAAFEVKLNRTLADYIDHHRAEGEHVVTFSTIKHHHQHDSRAEAKTKKDAKHRKHGRTARAHALRVERFVRRHAKTSRGQTATQ